jgi:hypothetical protein
MHKRLKAAVAPTMVAAAITWAGVARAQGPDPRPKRLDELGEKRPAAATHLPVEGALLSASQAVDVERWIEAAKAHQLKLFYEGVIAAEAEKAAAFIKAKPKPVARTGSAGGGGGATVGGACGGAANGYDRHIGPESGGNPNARGAGGAWGCYQIIPSTWSANCSDLGQHGSASTDAQAACASRLPPSSWPR